MSSVSNCYHRNCCDLFVMISTQHNMGHGTLNIIAANDLSVFTITEKAPSRAFSWFKAPTRAFTFKTLIRHYTKQTLTPPSVNVKLGHQRNYHKGRAAIRHSANQPSRLLRQRHNFTSTYSEVNAHLAFSIVS